MGTDLLVIKLQIPPQPHHELLRIPLVEALERNVPLHRVTSVAAPAGYGKTTLLAQWARTSRFLVAWVSLGEDDNDLVRLLRSLVAAWTAVPGSPVVVIDLTLGESTSRAILMQMLFNRDLGFLAW